MENVTPDAEFVTGGNPDWLAVDRHVWVSNAATNTVSRFDPATNRAAGTIAVGREPGCGLATAFGSLWVPNCGDETMSRIDLETGAVTAVFPMTFASSEGGICAGAGGVWVPAEASGILARINPFTNRIEARIGVAADSCAAAIGGDLVYVTSAADSVVTVVDTRFNAVAATIAVGPQPRFLAVSADSVWTLNQGDGTVTRVDIASGTVVATIDSGIPGPGGEIAVGGGSVWATSFGTPITRIDPQTNAVAQQFVGAGGDAIRVGLGSVWLSNLRKGNVWRIDVRRIESISADA
ncbi:40-residue YVTN family beta-propeller repeat-containing protein [Mycolicibacterium fluoranthenivorans]|uniref:40-residue YVTN family beta-propeller repeat-containing protein n=2 Tax=Mycolicibacterium fluoranthenivorans TaxID=258505 RepID=A0A1G4WRN5_9MYCO|nr:40-residue YVTN family beta-propeller repeat-containing protein [Mycolicibacterium fluoranthenivorans]